MNVSSSTVLHVDGLAFAYGREDVICDVSFDVAHGEFVSIIGPNGAGKSTILKSVMRLLPADRGRIEIDGHALSALSQRQLAQTVSYVPQELRGTMPDRKSVV